MAHYETFFFFFLDMPILVLGMPKRWFELKYLNNYSMDCLRCGGTAQITQINMSAEAFCTNFPPVFHFMPCCASSLRPLIDSAWTTVGFSLRRVLSVLEPQRWHSSSISLDPGEGTTPRVSQQELHWVVYGFTCLPFRPRSEQVEENRPIESSSFLPPSPPSTPFSPSLFFPTG